ncbi:MAG: Hsp33 family molecular chaperone HslO [Holophagales bacterium]|nr:MAG: Hsp33 family molecular chaperone HslO [Holophagales bacterium]
MGRLEPGTSGPPFSRSTRDRLVHGLAGLGDVRWAVADLGGVVEEARRRHDLSPIAASALGRTMSGAALLMFLSTKAWERMVVDVRGDGPLGKVTAEIDASGNLRGLVGEPRVESADGERLSIAAAVGKGLLRVRREGPRGAHESQVELATGEIGLDLAHYLEQSEQTSSAVMLGVLARSEGVAAAGGMIVELMPAAREEHVAALERNIAALGGVSPLLERSGVAGLVEAVLAGLDREILGEQELRFRCRCRRDELRQRLATLPEDDRASLADEQGRLVAECAYCAARYVFSTTELAPS